MSPSPGIIHQTIVYKIAMLLGNEIEGCEACAVLGEVDWKVHENTVAKPDVVMICNESNEEYITKTPEIVVEVISPSSALRDEKYKFDIYEQEKTPFYILAYPKEGKAKIYRLKDDRLSKEGDFFTETYQFDQLTCPVKIDFSKVFKPNE